MTEEQGAPLGGQDNGISDNDDLILTFQPENSHLRGRLVRIGPVLQTILSAHRYPSAVARIFGETVALTVALAGALKYDGVFTLQTQSDGPVSLIVVDITSSGAVRGYAKFDPERVEKLTSEEAVVVPHVLGAGHLAFTVDQGADMDRYQGIVALEGATMADCAHNYFRQSEQVETVIKIACGLDEDYGWRASALMLQKMPLVGEPSLGADLPEERADTAEERWRTALILMGSATPAEMLNPDLSPQDLLFRLFHEDGVRVFPPGSLYHQCRCSRERVGGMLSRLPAKEQQFLKEDGAMTVTCEFCNTGYAFNEEDLDAFS